MTVSLKADDNIGYVSGAGSLMTKRFLLFLLSITLVSSIAQLSPVAKAASWYYVTARTAGVYPNSAVKVYAGNQLMGTIYGEGTLTFNTTYGPTISVDRHTPDGYPFYGYPYYVYPGPLWGPLGHQGVAFYCRSNSMSVPANTSSVLTFRYDPLFFLFVKSERGSPQGSGWYLAGTWAYLSVSAISDEAGGTRCRFDRWTGGQLRDDGRTASNLVFMDGPKMVEAVWVTQHLLTVNSPQGEVSGGGWYDRGQSAAFSVASTTGEGEGVRYVFSGWTGDFSGKSSTGSIIMDAPKTVTTTWNKQCRLSVESNGGQVDKMTQWLDAGSTVSVSAVSPSAVVEKKSRLIFVGWEGDSTATSASVTVSMDSPQLLRATWKRQLYLTIDVKQGAATGEDWYDANSMAEFSVQGEHVMEPPLGYLGGKYVFSGWTGDITSTSLNGTILMDAPHSVMTIWTADYTIPAIIVAIVAAVVAALLFFTVKKGSFSKVQLKWRKGEDTVVKQKDWEGLLEDFDRLVVKCEKPNTQAGRDPVFLR
ncbi:MAG: hypothetical protein V1857_06140 [archaeon]